MRRFLSCCAIEGETEMRLRFLTVRLRNGQMSCANRLLRWEARIHGTLKKSCLRLACAFAFTNAAIAQDAVPLSRTNRSIIPTQDQPAVRPGGFQKEDHITGDWDGYRE